MVEVELYQMVARGIIESISHSEWAAPIVPVLKPDKKSIRICADFKKLNNNLLIDKYPLPKIDELMTELRAGNIFSTIDLKQAYLQIEVAEESRKYLVINTHKGLFNFKRLPFGLASSPAIFQRFISNILKDIPGCAAYLDGNYNL